MLALGLLAIAWILAGVYTTLVPAKYLTRTTLVFPGDDAPSKLSLGAGLLGDKDDTAMYRGILESYPVQNSVATKIGMPLKDIKKYLDIKPKPDTKELSVEVEDADKDKALEAVKTALGELTDITRSISFSKAERQADLLGKLIVDKRKAANEANQKVVQYAKSMHAPIDPTDFSQVAEIPRKYGEVSRELEVAKESFSDAQARLTKLVANGLNAPSGIEALDNVRKEIVTQRAELDTLQVSFGEDAPNVRLKEKELDVLVASAKQEQNKILADIRNGSSPLLKDVVTKQDLLKHQVKAVKPIADATYQEAVDFGQLVKEAEVGQAIVSELRQQYETAKVQAAVDRLKWYVLEQPHTLEEPTNKSYLRNMAVASSIALLIFGIAAYFKT